MFCLFADSDFLIYKDKEIPYEIKKLGPNRSQARFTVVWNRHERTSGK